jgi:hypothetical protein
MKNYTLTLLLTAAPLFAGTPAPVAPAPQQNTEQGWTLGLEVLALQPYQSEGYYDDNDFDAGYRGSLGYQFNDGLFVKATYFGYATETDNNEDLKAQYVDLIVGQNFKPMDKLTMSPFAGLRWGNFKEDLGDIEFDGYGVVLGLDVTRALGNNFSLYANAKQSLLVGTTDYSYSESYDSDTTGFVTEVGLGLQYDFCLGSVAGNVRAGLEGQYWAGLSDDDSENTSLAGFALGVNFRF